MELVPSYVHRTLAYLALLNAQGVDPTKGHLDEFASATVPRPERYEQHSAFLGRMPASWAAVRRPAEPVSDYLIQVGWAAASIGPAANVTITEIGQSVLRGLNSERAMDLPDAGIADVVLEPGEPLAWVHLTRTVAAAGAGMLVDAYFKPESVPWLIEATTIRRVLVSSRHRDAERDLARMGVALASVPKAADELVVRSTSSAELHDRCLIHADGVVQLLGASINGVGRNLTAIVLPHVSIQRTYRELYEGLWDDATPVDPCPPKATSTILLHARHRDVLRL